ncbi:hypothetical protein V8D89_014724, partial [Ganoderma adspersum]
RVPTKCLLPPELEFIIIDHLLSNKPALASCSLVCSRWLPASRRHLFQDVVVNPSMRLNPDSFADFLSTLEYSGGGNIEWAIGPCITKLTFDGIWDLRLVLTCPLSLLCAFLPRLPQLASLFIKKLVVLDEYAPAERREIARFKLDELVVDRCSAQGYDDPRHLLALLSRFSSIRSLTVDGWWVWKPDSVPAFSLDTFSPPLIHSLTLKWLRPVCARAIYALLASSPSATNGCLTRVSLFGGSPEDFAAFSDFARIPGPAIRELELHVLPHLPGPLDMFRELSLTTCTALRSLVLCIQPLFDDDWPGHLHADDTREMLAAYTHFFHRHRDVFPALRVVRLEMRPEGQEMLAAFVRVARDTYREWHERAVQTVSAEEVEQNRDVWAALEDALCGLPALERAEFVLYEWLEHNEILTDEAKAELRSALEGRLPRLWPGGIVQLVFEVFVYRSR